MLIDLGAILRGECDKTEFEYTTESPSDFDDVFFSDRMTVRGAVKNSGGYMSLEVFASVPYTTHCARCWKQIDKVFELSFSKSVAEPKTLQNEDNDDYIIISNSHINIDDPLLEAVALSFPLTCLCSEDCKGLCMKCGKDLNEGKCDCPKKEIDPRLEILKKLLDK